MVRALPDTVLGRDELLALGGLLIQLNGALLSLTDQLIAPTHRDDHTRSRSGAPRLLLDCRNSYLAARTATRAFHAEIKR